MAQKQQRTANRRLAKKRVQCLNEALCFVSSSVLADSLVLRNPLLRQAPNRWEPKVAYSSSGTEYGETHTCSYAGVTDDPESKIKGTVQILLFGVDQYYITISGPSFIEKCGDNERETSPAHGYFGLHQLPISGNIISGKHKIEKDTYAIEVEYNLTGYK